jgi:hypothetical protein
MKSSTTDSGSSAAARASGCACSQRGGSRLDRLLAYSFIDVKNAPINVVPGYPSFNGLATYTGSSKGNVSIFSIGVKYMTAPPPAPIATRG